MAWNPGERLSELEERREAAAATTPSVTPPAEATGATIPPTQPKQPRDRRARPAGEHNLEAPVAAAPPAPGALVAPPPWSSPAGVWPTAILFGVVLAGVAEALMHRRGRGAWASLSDSIRGARDKWKGVGKG